MNTQQTVEIQVTLNLACAECEADLSFNHSKHKNGTEFLTVPPCKSCMEAEREQGKADQRAEY